MAKEVTLTYIAEDEYNNIIDYLTLHWGISVVNNFVSRFEQVLTILSEDPGRFRFADNGKNTQRCVLTKHNVIYFIELEETVEIVRVFDTRQNPERLTSSI